METDSFGSFKTKNLFETCNLSLPLRQLYLDLVSPLEGMEELCLSKRNITIKIPKPGAKYWEQAASMVNFGYNRLYLKDSDSTVDLEGEGSDRSDLNLTVVAIDKFGDKEIVVGTHRLVFSNNLEVFRLFEAAPGNKWLHEQRGGTGMMAEYTRLAFHPLIDALIKNLPAEQKQTVYDYRKWIMKNLWVFSQGAMKGLGVEVAYLILAPNVNRFLRRSNLFSTELSGVVPSRNEYSREIREKFKEYWKPDAEPQDRPKVYLAPRVFSDDKD